MIPEIKQIKVQLSMLENGFEDFMKKAEEVKNTNKNLNSENGNLKLKNKELESKISELESKISELESKISESTSINNDHDK